MTDTVVPRPSATALDSPSMRLLSLLSGAGIAHAISVIARLGVADTLAGRSMSVDEIAGSLDADAFILGRLLRGLADMGLVIETDRGHFALSEMGELLRTEVPGSIRGYATMIGMPFHRAAWTALYDSVRSGELPFASVHGASLFEYLGDRPADAAVFDAAMTASVVPYQAFTEVFDFGQFATVVDVGGGRGHTLTAILTANPGVRGVLFDLPEVVELAGHLLESAGVADRCRIAAGSFFDTVPSGGDAYVLSNIIHDWDDRSSLQILRTCRRCMTDRARLVIVEGILADGPGGALSRMADLELLVIAPGGRLRNCDDYAELFAQSGFCLDEVVPAGPAAVITAIPVGDSVGSAL